MPRGKRSNIGRRSRSNVRRATSRANRTDDQQETENDNSRIGMAHLVLNQNEVDRQRMQRVRAHRSQQQRAREKEIDRFRKRNAPVNRERAAFSYDPEIDYSAEKSLMNFNSFFIMRQIVTALDTSIECLIVKHSSHLNNFLAQLG
ncbi:hypothetical protein J6590_074899 [Homalodisca vitripennis]|nr:hypothetical protein J6590_074899 [Homalodisca vitripennis]